MKTGQHYTDIGSAARVSRDTKRVQAARWCRETGTVSPVTVKTDFLLNYFFLPHLRFL